MKFAVGGGSLPSMIKREGDGSKDENGFESSLTGVDVVSYAKTEEGDTGASSKLYCVCQQPEKVGDTFIGCDECGEW